MKQAMQQALTALGVAAGLMIGASSASAATVLDAWRLNLALLNGQTLTAADMSTRTISSATNATNIDFLGVQGKGTIEQQVVGGSALGQSFTEDGYLQLQNYLKENQNASIALNFGVDDQDNPLYGFISFEGLTGTLNADGTITFDAGSGTIKLWVENDGDLDHTTGHVLELAEYELISPSGGSGNLDFYGGSANNGTIDVTAKVISALFNGLFADSSNNPLTTIALHLVNTNSLLDDDLVPNPDNSGVNPQTGNGTSKIVVENAGQYKLAVPEPGVAMLLGSAMLALGLGVRRRSRKGA